LCPRPSRTAKLRDMAQRPIKMPRRGGQLSGKELRRLAEIVEQPDRQPTTTAQSGGIGIRQSSSGRTLDNLHFEPFWARIVAGPPAGDDSYSWVELYETDPDNSPGDFSTLTNGRAGAAPLMLTGTTTSGSAVVTGISPATTGLLPGQTISGTGITSSPTTYILSVDSSTQITLTANATANGTVSLTFGTNMAPAYEVNGDTAVSVGTIVQ